MQLPDFIKRAAAFFDKADANLTAETKLTEANARITQLETDLVAAQTSAKDATNATAQVTTLTTERDTARAEVATHAATITDLTAKLEAANRKAGEVLAAQGLPADSLPTTSPNPAAGGSVTDPVAKLREKLVASTDPKEKFRISAQIRDLLAKKK
jgi:hypothetical protein